jgi:putative ABC transport system permease protein
MVEINDGSQAASMGKAIDGLFENSSATSITETEQAFKAGFIAMAGNLAFLLNGIGLAVAFTILLVTANTMSMAVRERRTEIAVLKTLGFQGGTVLGLILGEALMLGFLGGTTGLLLGFGAIKSLTSVPMLGGVLGAYPNLGLTPVVAAEAMALALVLGVVAGFLPAFTAYRSKVTDQLRTV